MLSIEFDKEGEAGAKVKAESEDNAKDVTNMLGIGEEFNQYCATAHSSPTSRRLPFPNPCPPILATDASITRLTTDAPGMLEHDCCCQRVLGACARLDMRCVAPLCGPVTTTTPGAVAVWRCGFSYLTIDRMTLPSSTVDKECTPQGSVNNRNALAKDIYNRIFAWLIQTVCNGVLEPAGEKEAFVGLLDIFGEITT